MKNGAPTKAVIMPTRNSAGCTTVRAMVSAMILAGVRGEETRGRMYFYFGILSGVAPGILALSTNMPLALVGAAALGASTAGFMTLTHTMIQSMIPDGVRGRVAGVYSIHIGGTMASVNLLNGGLADYVNAPLILAIGGIGFIFIMVFSLKYVSLRQIYTRGLQPQMQSAAD